MKKEEAGNRIFSMTLCRVQVAHTCPAKSMPQPKPSVARDPETETRSVHRDPTRTMRSGPRSQRRCRSRRESGRLRAWVNGRGHEHLDATSFVSRIHLWFPTRPLNTNNVNQYSRKRATDLPSRPRDCFEKRAAHRHRRADIRLLLRS